MHICLPDTREVKPPHGSAFLLYNVHIDGLYHCSLRFKQLLHLHQALSKKFTGSYNHQLPPFPPKKLLPLSSDQIEERRMQLEKYLQNISQDKAICNSSIFNLFLLEAQRESTRIGENQVHLDIELVNGQKIRLQIVTHDSADTVLTAVCRALGLNDRYHAYFCLCLCGYDVIRDKLIIKRRLSFFESPYVTLQMAIQQQEQLQNVLSNSYSPSSSSSSNNNNNNNNGSSSCRCQSCSTQQHSNNLTTGALSLVGSSSGSYLNDQQQIHYKQNNNNNSYQHHHQYHSNQACFYQNSSNANRQALASTSSISFVTHRILLRKSYWDPIYDTYILNDQQALNLLFIQTVYDIKHSLMFVNRETYHQLESLLSSDSKIEYILLARTLKYYNYVHFEPCLSDYPRPRTKVMISIGSKELNMRVLKSPKTLSSRAIQPSSSSSSSSLVTTAQTSSLSLATSQTNNNSNNSPAPTSNQQVSEPSEHILYCTSSLVPIGYHHLITKDDLIEEEYNFKVPLIRCWRLTSLETLNSNSPFVTTTTGNGKRKSLSLFNSVISGHNQNEINRLNGSHQSNSSMINSGTSGASLLAALTGRTNTGDNENSQFRCQNGHHSSYCQHQCEAIDNTQFSQYELSFEYLVSKDRLKWITISSDQAIFISISLQGVVDELVSKRDGRSSLYKSADLTPKAHILPARSTHKQSFTYMRRDGAQKPMNTSNQQLIDKFGTTFGYSPMNTYALALARQRQQVRASLLLSSNSSRLSSAATLFPETSGAQQTALEISSFKKASSPIINDAFEGVTNDDDL